MNDLTITPRTDPTAIYRHRDALYASDMLIVALKELDLFTYLASAPKSLDAICRHFQIHARPTDVMTTFLVASGWLAREGELLSPTEKAREHLVAESPWFIGPYFPPVKDRPIAIDLLGCLRTDQPANFASRSDHQDWHRAMETEAFALEFTAMMDCRGVFLAQALAKNLDLQGHRQLLDIAGGSGVYACSMCAHFPELTATVLEKPPVDTIAARAIADRGFSDRIRVVADDMFQAGWPPDHDIHLISNVLHDWDIATVQGLLASSAQSLPTGGKLIVHDTFLNPEKTGPLHIAEYSVLLMHVTQGRCYSEKEICDWAHAAGLRSAGHVPSGAMRSALLFTKQ